MAVRERADWTCEVCGKKYQQPAQNLHCSHFYSRRHRSIRWHPLNAFSHDFGCHQRLGENPAEFVDWVEKNRPESLAMRDLVNVITKVTKKDRKLIALHYKAEYEKMRALRDLGSKGRLYMRDWR